MWVCIQFPGILKEFHWLVIYLAFRGVEMKDKVSLMTVRQLLIACCGRDSFTLDTLTGTGLQSCDLYSNKNMSDAESDITNVKNGKRNRLCLKSLELTPFSYDLIIGVVLMFQCLLGTLAILPLLVLLIAASHVYYPTNMFCEYYNCPLAASNAEFNSYHIVYNAFLIYITKFS